MQARSALFDLYGDHLRPRGGRAAVAALVRLLAPLGIAAPAVRTAVSRMVRQGWLQPLRLPTGPGYGITPKAARRLDAAGARIYRTPKGDAAWDGRFDLITLDPPQHRGARAKLVANLGFLGYGAIDPSTWIAPRPGEGVDALLAEAGVRFDRFSASHVAGGGSLVTRAWDLDEIGAAYQDFVARLTPVVAGIGPGTDDEQAYAARFTLVHAWRAFLFRDPQLPPELLPQHWPGTAAAAFFDRHAGRLRPAADRYVDQCLHS
ncbi:PaaX family transcriptional regulator C-terminal domain-containing protein [Dactylosporangium sp. NPDC050688]|uniref:PaaX family transcriptional regulator n=1 Tax=Dactylosporangium sp. NPDC050688 TaxID=3157217 RepID=UPI0033CEC955